MAVDGYRRFQASGGVGEYGSWEQLEGPVVYSPILSGGAHRASCPWGENNSVLWPEGWHTDPTCVARAVRHLREPSSYIADNCGFSACKTLAYLMDQIGGSWGNMFRSNVTAAVKLWGQILEYEHGYRAEYMQIDHLWLDGPVSPEKEQQAVALSMRYGVGCDISPSVVATSVRQVEAGEYVWIENGCQVVFIRKEVKLDEHR